MIDDSFFESLAHYASSMATLSFGMWAVILYKWRKRNRMTFLLFISVAYIALSFLKDIIFRFPPQLFDDAKFVEDIVSIFDLSFVPLVCAFFLEATRPGFATNKRLLLAYLPFMALLPLYCLLRANCVVVCSFALSIVVALCTLVAVPINVIHYNKYISDNYSYTKNISVGWCVGCMAGLFLLIVFYEICFYEATWFSEMAYDTVFVIIWNVVCMKCRRHRVVADMMAFDDACQPAEEPKPLPCDDTPHLTTDNEPPPPTPLPTDSEQAKDYSFISSALLQCMETQKLYLNSHLSLSDLATAVGSNKTYISAYINSQGTTFYDFINRYRIDEACRIIDEMATGGKVSMADVASRSGFNSVSSFNRYFSKIKGITPTAYSRQK